MSREESFNKAFRELVKDWKGNFIFMPFAKRKKYASIMASAVYYRYRTNLAIKLLCKLDLYFLTKFLLGYADLSPKTHLPFCDHVMRNISSNLNVIPRGYFKTTITTKSGSIFLIINDANIRILICNATAANAELFVKEIKGHFENNSKFKKLFASLIPKNFKNVPWGSDRLQVERSGNYSEPTIRAVGLETNITSGHFNVIIEDDLVNEDHITSLEMMQKPIDWDKMSHSLYVPEDDPKKKLNWRTGTRWSFFDYIHEMFDIVPKEEQYVLSCFDEDEKSTFPEKFPLEELERIRNQQGIQIFSAQYLNNPLPGEMATVRPEWFKYYDELPENVPLRCFLLVDPAISENRRADNRAMVIVYVDEKKNWYVEDYVRGKLPYTDVANSNRKTFASELFRLYQQHRPEYVGIEDVAFQQAMKFDIKNQMEARGLSFHIWSLKPRNRQTKMMRIEALAGVISAGRVYFKRGNSKEIEEELLGFPVGRYDDLADALSYMVQVERAPSEPLLRDDNPFVIDNIMRELRFKRQGEYPFAAQVVPLA